MLFQETTLLSKKTIRQHKKNRLVIDKIDNKVSLHEILLEELFFQQAQEKHMIPSSADIERQIVALKMSNDIAHLNNEEFEKQLQDELGITLEQYKGQLTRILAVENIKQAETSEKTFVTSQEVETYHEQHPEYTREQYHLKLCSLSKKDAPDYKKFIHNEKTIWKDLGWVNKEDIDTQFSFVLSMKPKQIGRPIKSGNKYIVLLLQDKKKKKKKTLQDRYGEIEKKLQKEKQKKIVDRLEHDLIEQAYVVFL